ncbi:MAG: class A beta-lactamase-related serine hydrolase, partial [Chitinophagaceae bacterium]
MAKIFQTSNRFFMQLQYFAGVSGTTGKVMLVLTTLLLSVRALTQVEPTWQTNLDQQLTSWESVKSPAISVAVVKNGQVLYSKSNGMANIHRGLLNDSTTQFWIASVTKQFTAAAIYKLVQHTNLSLSTSIRFLLPELPPLFEPVTIDHLLHHTSGIRDGFVLTALSKKPQSAYTNENVLHYLKASKHLNFSPGTRYEYNNAGYVLLAMAVEKVAGTAFPVYLKDSIFHPLGMHNSYVASSFPLNAKQAEGYREASGNIYDAYHF